MVELQNDPAPEQQSLQPDAADEREAQRKIDEKQVKETDVPEPEKR